MSSISDFLISTRRMLKLHENMLREISQTYALTLTEATIISFLHNNPGRDTAADIVELRMLQKSNVSLAVETLNQRGYLDRKQDASDRRKIHLYLTEQADPVIADIDSQWAQFEEEMLFGISSQERDKYIQVNEKMQKNIAQALKRREQNERR